jgi:serine/threonine protein kinase
MISDPVRETPSGSERLPEQPSQLFHILEGYMAELEKGVQPQVEALVAKYPDHAEALRVYCEKLTMLRRAAFSLRGGVLPGEAPANAAGDSPGQLDDYTILREVGRGGMGVVYEALQTSLGRRVALKVLPVAAALDPRQLQRFKNEAQAAAQLSHPNIVSVFGVGCDRGVHYYAMQFIDGQTLAALIEALRHCTGTKRPEPTVSLWTVWASRYARGQAGTSKDTNGIGPADVALADSTTQNGHGQEDNLSATLSCTSPVHFRRVAQLGVQAAEALEHAHEMGVVHRDVKPANLLVDEQNNLWITDFGLAQLGASAGLTMTGDLLGTLRYMSPEQALAKRGLVDQRTDIYALGATLYELAALQPLFTGRDREELLRQIAFEEPRPPRRLNPAIPADLETILLKATTKDPAGRYATAQELADDLHRFLEDKPILARRPTLTQRAAKLARRHRAVLTTTVAMALIGLAVSTFLFWRGKSNTESQKTQTIQQRELARDAADAMYRQMQKWLAYEPQLEDVQQESLKTALRFYNEFANERGDGPEARHKAALAAYRVGDIHLNLAKWPLGQESLNHQRAATEATNQAIALFEPLVAEFPDNFDYQQELADCYMALGILSRDSQPDVAKIAFLQSRDKLDRLALAFPDQPEYRNKLAACNQKLGSILLDDSSEASQKEAAATYGRAEQLLTRLVAENPKQHEYAHQLAEVYRSEGELFQRGERWPPAMERFGKAVALGKKLHDDPLCPPDWRLGLGIAEYELASVMTRVASAEAERACLQGIALSCLPVDRCQLGSALGRLGIVAVRGVRLPGAIRTAKHGVGILERLVEVSPQVPRYQGHLGLALGTLADLHGQQGDLRVACEQDEKSIVHQEAAHRVSPGSFTYGLGLQQRYKSYGRTLVLLHEYEKAAQAAENLANVIVRCPLGETAATEILACCAPMAERDSRLSPADRRARAEAYWDRAMVLDRQAAKTCTMMQGWPQLENNAAWFLVSCPDPKRRDATLAVSLAEKAVKEAPKTWCYWNTLALAYYRQGNLSAAIHACEEAIALDGGADSTNWLFLAMAQWQSGQREEARKNYAIALRDRSKASDDEVCRFRAEAAELFGT